MRVSPIQLTSLAVAAFAIALGGCQGNLGSGSGLSLPATQPNAQPPGPGGAAAQTRQRTLDGAVYLTPDMTTLPLPPLDGFAVTLQLGATPPSPTPSPTATPTSSATPARRNAKHVKRRTKTRAVAVMVAATETAQPSGGPPSASSIPSAAPAAASPSPARSGAGVKTVTKLVVYPEDAPGAPTPQPSGNVQTYPVRKALVRGFIKPGVEIALYGLAAVRFTIPAEEDTAQRGYTVAVFAAGRHHHDALVASDPKASVATHVVASSALDGLVLKKNVSYLLVLYADELAATPGAVPAGYPAPGNNPFVTPLPGGSAGPNSAATAAPVLPH